MRKSTVFERPPGNIYVIPPETSFGADYEITIYSTAISDNVYRGGDIETFVWFYGTDDELDNMLDFIEITGGFLTDFEKMIG